MATYVYRCTECGDQFELHDDAMRLTGHPQHCGTDMKRDYRAESATATFRGGGWARSGK